MLCAQLRTRVPGRKGLVVQYSKETMRVQLRIRLTPVLLRKESEEDVLGLL